MICKDLECVIGKARRILEKEGVTRENFNVIVTDLPYVTLSILDGSTVKINSLLLENYSNNVNNEARLVSAFLLIAILNAFLKDKAKTRDIIKKYFGEGSIEEKSVDVIL